ncbi:MAG: HEPN domain-containing protein [Chloroflexota bacterium]
MFQPDQYAGFLQKQATEHLEVAKLMILKRKRYGAGLFFAHAALQNSFAALICKNTHNRPPWRSDLTRLAKLAKIRLTKEQRELCKVMNFYHKEGLYLGLEYPEPTKKDAYDYWLQARIMILTFSTSLAE